MADADLVGAEMACEIQGWGYRQTIPPLGDGLYWVTTAYLCAGFVVDGGRVVRCAPILRSRLSYWMTVAVRVGD